MNEQLKDPRLGKKAKDKVTRTTCITAHITDPGKSPSEVWFSDERVEIIED